MRPFLQIFVLMLSILATSVSLHGQQFSQPLNSGYWTFGLNTGKAYQSSDVKSSASGFGVGLTFGKNIYYQPGATLDFGIRGRLSYNQTKGLSPIRNYNIANNTAVNGLEGLDYTSFPDGLEEDRGFIFSNYKTDLAGAGVEAVLTLNELKEKTGVKVSLFGGVDANIYNVRTDQSDRSGNEYFEGYASVNDRGPTSEINRNLRNAILDGEYETQADGFANGPKAGFMPSLGAEVGFQVTPKFSIDLGHRTTFSGTDLLDGERWGDSDNDILHYTYMGANFNINKKEKAYLAPEIIIMQPRNATVTDVQTIEVYAKINNVEMASDVELLVNGKSKPFNFRKEKLSATVFLQKGENDIEIFAGNFGGEDRKHVNILFEKRTVVVPPPPVRSTPPPVVYRPGVEILNTNRTIRKDRFKLEARTKNIEFREDIQLFVNGRNTNFQFDRYHQKVEATIHLLPGENDVVLSVFNNAGEAEDRMIVVFDDRIAPPPPPVVHRPSVKILNKNKTIRNDRFKIEARTKNIESIQDIELFVNGRNTSIKFNQHHQKIDATVHLLRGENDIVLRVFNNAGEAEDRMIVVFDDRVPAPSVEITQPEPQFRTSRNEVKVVAATEFISGKRDILFTVNGREVRHFDFSNNCLTKQVQLEEGRNIIRIRVENESGFSEDKVVVFHKIVQPDLKEPIVKIISPTDHATVKNKTIELVANITEVRDDRNIELLLNDAKVNGFTFTHQTLKAKLTLKKGSNKITLRAANKDGRDAQTVIVKFEGEKEVVISKPTVKLVTPTNNQIVRNKAIIIKGETRGARSVDVFVNNVKLNNVNIDRRNFTATADLKNGKNTIKVKATNRSGGVEETVTVTFKKKIEVVKAPTIEIITPTNRKVVNQGFEKLEATVKSAEKVEVLVNDKKVRNVTFNRQRLAAMLNLKKGTNKVVVKATNKGGTTSESITVIYKEKIVAPVKEIKQTVVKSPSTNTPDKVIGTATSTKADVKPAKSKVPIGKKSTGGF